MFTMRVLMNVLNQTRDTQRDFTPETFLNVQLEITNFRAVSLFVACWGKKK